MLQEFPWSKIGILINGKVPSIPERMKDELKKAITLRNQIVHSGEVKLERETVRSVLTIVRDLLYFLDALRGQKWAINHINPETLGWFDDPNSPPRPRAPAFSSAQEEFDKGL